MAGTGIEASGTALRWNPCRFREGCLITGGDARQEWMLPWWYENARRHNDLPVVFVDAGLSRKALAWCRARGEVVSPGVPVANAFLAKPFAILKSPYSDILWTDLDCEILKPVETIFSQTPAEIGVVPDAPGASDPIQAGVIVVRHGGATILEWAALCRDWRKLDRSQVPTGHKDQSLLGHLWRQRPEAFTLLGGEWNRSRIIPDGGQAEDRRGLPGDSAIIHWWGRHGKEEIRRRIASLPSGDPGRALEPGRVPLVFRRIQAEFSRRRLPHPGS